MKNRIIKITFFCLILSFQVRGQVIYPGDFTSDYYDILLLENGDQLTQPIGIHPSIISAYGTDSLLTWDIWRGIVKTNYKKKEKGLSISVLNPSMSFDYNSSYPRGYNRGPLWLGKGVNSSLTGGITGNVGILHFSIAPVLSYSQNSAYYIANANSSDNPYAYPFSKRIDWVQRYGTEPEYKLFPGQSELRVIYKKATIGVSTENFRWGPAKYNPILMSKNAAGFPHIDIGTSAPVRSIIGFLEFKLYWGLLRESDYFDEDPENDQRFITGFTFGYSPKYIKGLSVGLNRIMYRPIQGPGLNFKDDIIKPFSTFEGTQEFEFNGNLVNDVYDQMVSVFVDWSFANAGFSAYVEFARNDFNGGIRDKIVQPEHSRGFTLGFSKTFHPSSGKVVVWNYEHSTLGHPRNHTTRASPSFYIHHIAWQGYTQNGQIIGAGIGPGSNSDVMELQFFNKNGLASFYTQRIRFNDDYFFDHFTKKELHDVEYTLGGKYLRFIGNYSIGADISLSRRLNWYYELDSDKTNLHLMLSVTRRIQ